MDQQLKECLFVFEFVRMHVVMGVIKIENENGENVKETTYRPKSRQQSKVTNWSSTQRENTSPGGQSQHP